MILTIIMYLMLTLFLLFLFIFRVMEIMLVMDILQDDIKYKTNKISTNDMIFTVLIPFYSFTYIRKWKTIYSYR